MKRLFLLIVFLMAGVAAQAAPKGPLTLEAFLAKQKAVAEKNGKEFDEAKAKELFAKRDLDKDGTLSVEEQTPAPKLKEPMTLDAFLARRKAAAEKLGKEFDEAKAKELFAKKDLDQDGTLSVEEQTPAPKKENAE